MLTGVVNDGLLPVDAVLGAEASAAAAFDTEGACLRFKVPSSGFLLIWSTCPHSPARFLAAASHDILQPLNAARLYAASLVERPLATEDALLARNVDASLSAVEEIFSTLIEISRIDAGRLEAEIADFPLSEIFDQLRVEFEPMAQARGLALRVMSTVMWARSDRRLLRRILQNLVSNAIKYTRTGAVLLGVRRSGGSIVIQVCDTGPGSPRTSGS
ncbi:MAG: HAMP domain-containing histidine kinase [Akkermansiaceae bacterium]|nr:HAMP domain-containing histidine kinase [Akkermansiaceae bacterium]